jgi:hypothetical protein
MTIGGVKKRPAAFFMPNFPIYSGRRLWKSWSGGNITQRPGNIGLIAMEWIAEQYYGPTSLNAMWGGVSLKG